MHSSDARSTSPRAPRADAQPVVAERARAAPDWASRALAAGAVATIGFLIAQLLCFGYGRDQGIYSVVAGAVLEGRMPYRDAWDFKPPGVFLIYALARSLFGDSQASIRVLEAFGLVAMVVAMVRLAELWWGEALLGLLAGAVAVLVHVQLDFWHTAQPESFGGMLTIAGLLLATAGEPALDRRATTATPRFRAWLGAGALFGAAGLLKPPLAGAGAVVALALAFWRWRRAHDAAAPRRDRVVAAAAPIATIALGGAAPMALCAGWFAARGALGDMYAVLFVFTPHYTRLGWQSSSVAGMAWWGFTEWLTAYSSVLTAGLLVLLAVRPTRAERAGVALLLGVIGIQLVGVVMQGKFFPYHYGATWPPTALLASVGLWKVWRYATRWGAGGAAGFGAALVLVAFGRSATKDVPGSFFTRCLERIEVFTARPRDTAAVDRLASVADVNAAANRGAAEVLRARVPAGGHVFVWGFEPVIYELAGRPPASRFVYDVPQRVGWAKGPMRRVLMEDLAARPPAAIVVEHRDVFPMVTGDWLDSADSLHDFPELAGLLAARYELHATVEDLDVYLETGR